MSKEENLRTITNFSGALNSLKVVALAAVVAGVGLAGFFGYMYLEATKEYNRSSDELRQSMAVLDPVSGMRLRAEVKLISDEQRSFYKKALVTRYIDCAYDFDGNTFKENITQMGYLCSEDVYESKLAKYLNGNFNLGTKLRDKEMTWYASVSQEKIVLSTRDNGMSGVVTFVKTTKSPVNVGREEFEIAFKLKELDTPTKNNVYGYIIEEWSLIKQTRLKK